MRAKECCFTKHVDIRPRGDLTPEQGIILVHELVKHLLYMRNQIPGLFDDLDWQVQELEQDRQVQAEKARLALLQLDSPNQESLAPQIGMPQRPRKKRCLQTSQKRLIKFMQSAHALLDSIDLQLFASGQPMHVLIAFGPSASRPSELYSVAFPATGHQVDDTPQRTVTANELARRTIRALVMNTQDLPEGRASRGPTKVFLLASGCFTDASIPAGFAYRRDFRLRMKKGIQVHMDLIGAVQPDAQPGAAVPCFSGSAENVKWYQSKFVLKGLRSPGGDEVDRAG